MINTLSQPGVKTSGVSQLQAPGVQVSAPAKKKPNLLGDLVKKAGGAEGILQGVSIGSAKAAQMLRNKKNGGAAPVDTIDFEAGLRQEKEVETILGMPAVAAYTAIGVVFLLVLFLVFKAASKK
ncbi:hypothetical protein Q0590_25145 [Rhodocytophaga aerolata]|uniref:Uncharacterized protein n=1 Tax=Rhodocytophaga aerolata TaxID=455078 RepID=A0ABT8REG2_9BACT|nr:hypothetical protein [Rhodocytophaga aerolata]MDO1449588.1 hypothetical protein [Rhodocytophaga aerolata]